MFFPSACCSPRRFSAQAGSGDFRFLGCLLRLPTPRRCCSGCSCIVWFGSGIKHGTLQFSMLSTCMGMRQRETIHSFLSTARVAVSAQSVAGFRGLAVHAMRQAPNGCGGWVRINLLAASEACTCFSMVRASARSNAAHDITIENTADETNKLTASAPIQASYCPISRPLLAETTLHPSICSEAGPSVPTPPLHYLRSYVRCKPISSPPRTNTLSVDFRHVFAPSGSAAPVPCRAMWTFALAFRCSVVFPFLRMSGFCPRSNSTTAWRPAGLDLHPNQSAVRRRSW